MAIDPSIAAKAAEEAEAEEKRKAADNGSWVDVADVAGSVLDLVGTAASSVGRTTAAAASTVTETAGTLATVPSRRAAPSCPALPRRPDRSSPALPTWWAGSSTACDRRC